MRRAENAVEQRGRATVGIFAEVVSILDLFGRLLRASWLLQVGWADQCS
jgi:hypothetical protein